MTRNTDSRRPDNDRAVSSTSSDRWKILIVDDETDAHGATRAALEAMTFEGREIRPLSAFTVREGRRKLREHPDIAIVYLDVDMGSTRAGLTLVRYIREELGNRFIRIVLQTGHPETTPAREVMPAHEVNGYRIKTARAADELFTTVLTGLRSYKSLRTMDASRDAPGWKARFKRSEERLRRQNEYMAALHETSLGMLNHLDLDELLNIIVKRAGDLVKMPDGVLHLYDHQAGVLEVKAGFGLFQNHVGFRVQPGEGLVGLVWEKGETMALEDYRSWPEHLEDGRLAPVRGVVAAPLKSNSGMVGVIGLSDQKDVRKIAPETIEILEQFARFAVIAIENARLYGEMGNELEKREKLEQERKKMETRLHQAQKMEAIGVLAGGIAHDFNNILASILGYTELALEDVEKGTLLQKNLKDVMMAGKRAADLVEQILTFSRQTDFEKKPVRMNLILKEVMGLLRATLPSTIRIRNNIRGESLIFSDPTQIHQVLMNLCANASHAMKESGGELLVELVDIDVDANFADKHPDLKPGPHVVLTVSDTGRGMTPEVLDRIFEPFFTTKRRGEGTGMGLSVIHGIVKSHGGTIFVYSEVGEGSTFKLFFPALERETEEQSELEKPIPGGDECILFVDDEAPVVKMGRQMLQRLGYRVVTSTSSVEALALFKEQPDKFDIVITDMTMPKMTGDVLTREILRIKPETPIILCTGFSAKMDKEKAMGLGIRAFVAKPFLVHTMAEQLRTILDEKKAAPRE